MRDKKENLRRGFSTGSCLAAAALGAWRILQSEAPEEAEAAKRVELLFPDGSRRELELFAVFREAGCGVAVIRKDAGDDPDITDRALFKVRLWESGGRPGRAAGFFDHRLSCGRARLIVRAAGGVGLVTRPGLDVEIGRWAINPVPLRMLAENLARAGCGHRPATWQIEVSIPDGRRLARKTLNPVLGIVDGLSLLGTTGYVEPYSHRAYIETIRILLRGARRAGCREVALCTGGRTARSVARDCPGLPDYAIVRIADFIADGLRLADECGFARVVVACMVGKLYKYAAGIEYTHAHTVRYDCSALAVLAARVGIAAEKVFALRAAASVREALTRLEADEIEIIYTHLGRLALGELRRWCGRPELELRLYDPRGRLLRIWNKNDFEVSR